MDRCNCAVLLLLFLRCAPLFTESAVILSEPVSAYPNCVCRLLFRSVDGHVATGGSKWRLQRRASPLDNARVDVPAADPVSAFCPALETFLRVAAPVVCVWLFGFSFSDVELPLDAPAVDVPAAHPVRLRIASRAAPVLFWVACIRLRGLGCAMAGTLSFHLNLAVALCVCAACLAKDRFPRSPHQQRSLSRGRSSSWSLSFRTCCRPH